jgi:hypothetical protein
VIGRVSRQERSFAAVLFSSMGATMKAYIAFLLTISINLLGVVACADAATTDPIKVIYRVSGVRDSGDAMNVGRATSFNCSNFSGVSERVVIQVRNPGGQLLATKSYTVPANGTVTASTHLTDLFGDDSLNTFGVSQGLAVIYSTTTVMICNAMIVDAGSASVLAVTLPMVRFNSWAGSQE